MSHITLRYDYVLILEVSHDMSHITLRYDYILILGERHDYVLKRHLSEVILLIQ